MASSTSWLPAWARMRHEAGIGEIDPVMEQRQRLIEAVNLVRRARREGRNVVEYVRQIDIFTGEGIHPISEAFLRLFFRDVVAFVSPAGRDKVATVLRFYVDEARKASAGADLLGATTRATPEAILALAKERQYGAAE